MLVVTFSDLLQCLIAMVKEDIIHTKLAQPHQEINATLMEVAMEATLAMETLSISTEEEVIIIMETMVLGDLMDQTLDREVHMDLVDQITVQEGHTDRAGLIMAQEVLMEALASCRDGVTLPRVNLPLQEITFVHRL